jgi:hypothetical protein
MSSKSEETRTRDAQATDEDKATLPVGHPQAGYVSPDGSFSDNAGIPPDKEKEWNEQRDQAHEDEVEAVADAEDKAVKEEQEAQEKARAAEVERLRKAPPGTLTPEQQSVISAADAEDAQKSSPKAKAGTSS